MHLEEGHCKAFASAAEVAAVAAALPVAMLHLPAVVALALTFPRHQEQGAHSGSALERELQRTELLRVPERVHRGPGHVEADDEAASVDYHVGPCQHIEEGSHAFLHTADSSLASFLRVTRRECG